MGWTDNLKHNASDHGYNWCGGIQIMENLRVLLEIVRKTFKDLWER